MLNKNRKIISICKLNSTFILSNFFIQIVFKIVLHDIVFFFMLILQLQKRFYGDWLHKTNFVLGYSEFVRAVVPLVSSMSIAMQNACRHLAVQLLVFKSAI